MWVKISLAEAYFNRGNVYADKSEYELAIEDYSTSLELENPQSAWVYTARGNTYSELGEYEHAITDFDRAIASDAEYIYAYHNRGLTHQQLGNHEQAIADFEQILELSDDPVLREQVEQRLEALRSENE
jgi:tetratricopeptide (TPR) repeat protein